MDVMAYQLAREIPCSSFIVCVKPRQWPTHTVAKLLLEQKPSLPGVVQGPKLDDYGAGSAALFYEYQHQKVTVFFYNGRTIFDPSTFDAIFVYRGCSPADGNAADRARVHDGVRMFVI